LDVTLDPVGRRCVLYKTAVDDMHEASFDDWDIQGPRTTLFCAREIAKCGGGPCLRFRQWKYDNKISDGDAGVDMLELISEVSEAAVCRDQLNIGNLMCMEKLERKRQYIEETYRQQSEEARLSKHAGRDAASVTADIFAGGARLAGGAIIAPSLLEHVAKKAAESSEILKQQRKALEARGLSVPKAGKKS